MTLFMDCQLVVQYAGKQKVTVAIVEVECKMIELDYSRTQIFACTPLLNARWLKNASIWGLYHSTERQHIMLFVIKAQPCMIGASPRDLGFV